MKKVYSLLLVVFLLLVSLSLVVSVSCSSKDTDSEQEEEEEEEDLAGILGLGANIPAVQYDQTTTIPGQPTVAWHVWMEGQKLRMEMSAEGQTMIYITDYSAMTVYMYYPAQNMAMEMDISTFGGAATDATEDIEQYDPTIIGTETLDGKACLVVTYDYSGQGTNATSKMWIWKDYGFAIRVETTVQGVTTIIETDNIVFGDIDDSMFELPEGVQIIDM